MEGQGKWIEQSIILYDNSKSRRHVAEGTILLPLHSS